MTIPDRTAPPAPTATPIAGSDADREAVSIERRLARRISWLLTTAGTAHSGASEVLGAALIGVDPVVRRLLDDSRTRHHFAETER